jgi:hypothetical protein
MKRSINARYLIISRDSVSVRRNFAKSIIEDVDMDHVVGRRIHVYSTKDSEPLDLNLLFFIHIGEIGSGPKASASRSSKDIRLDVNVDMMQ